MASQGRGRRGRPRGTGQAPRVFDQHAFVKAVGIATVAKAHAGSQGSIILRHSQGEEIRWWQTIGSCRSKRC